LAISRASVDLLCVDGLFACLTVRDVECEHLLVWTIVDVMAIISSSCCALKGVSRGYWFKAVVEQTFPLF